MKVKEEKEGDKREMIVEGRRNTGYFSLFFRLIITLASS